jgi:hypothetical protein
MQLTQREYLNWLNAATSAAMQFFKPLPADLIAAKPEPIPPRPPRVKPKAKVIK